MPFSAFLKKSIIIPLLVLIVISTFVLGFFIGQTTVPSIQKIRAVINAEQGKPETVDFSLFWDAWHLLEEKHVGRQNLDTQDMLYGAIAGMVKGLGDPYTAFMNPQESQEFLEGMSGEFEGIGAEIGIRDNTLTVIAPLEGSPAQRAGLRPGDKILKIDDTLTTDLSVEEAVTLIRGPKASPVVLTISRDGLDKAQEIEIIRETIKIPVLDLKFHNNIVQIKLYEFTQNSANEFEKTAQQVLDKKSQAIILDLRNNPGGYLDLAVEIAGWFLNKGEVVAIEDFGDAKTEKYYSQGPALLTKMPVVVLINQGSASASEILAGALRDNRQVLLVGEKSFGKGSVQELDNLAGGSSLKVTVARWLTPSGKSIQDFGLEPDYLVPLTEEDSAAGRDPQLDKALELLRWLWLLARFTIG